MDGGSASAASWPGTRPPPSCSRAPAARRRARARARGAGAGPGPGGGWGRLGGELAGDPAAAVLLAGLGVRKLSMAAPRIPEVKEALRSVSLAQAAEAAAAALELYDA